MAVIDASFLIAAWNRADAHHEDAMEMLRDHDGPLRLSAGSLVEASQIIRRRAKDLGQDGNEIARTFLDAFLRLPGAIIETAWAHDAWHRYLEANRMSYADAWVIEQSRRAGEPAWSFDQDLLAAAST